MTGLGIALGTVVLLVLAAGCTRESAGEAAEQCARVHGTSGLGARDAEYGVAVAPERLSGPGGRQVL